MMVDFAVMRACFWVCLVCIVIAGVLQMVSIWVPQLWYSYAWPTKLTCTAVVFGLSAFGIAITVYAFRWLVGM